MYVASLKRIGSFRVVDWRNESSFVICKGITKDTPVEYHQDDLPMTPATRARVPKYYRAPLPPRRAAPPAVPAAPAPIFATGATFGMTDGTTASVPSDIWGQQTV